MLLNCQNGNRVENGLTAAAPKRGRRVLEPNKIVGAPTPVPRRQEPIGRVGASHHVGFQQKNRLGPSWQTQTADPSHLTSHRR
jgi:hypothetical protein